MKIRELIERLKKFDDEDSALIVYSPDYPDDVRDVLGDMSADVGEANVIITNMP